MFLALLEAASGKRATVVGKPNPFIIDLALNRLGLSRDDVLIVGDTFETDVVAGLAAGIRTALVLTGNTKLAPPGQYRPTVIVPNLKALQMLLAKA
jgi:ribonucleotide monophosphatase NagD (HAD superfamily)